MREFVELERLIANLLRVGTIDDVDHANARARFRDGDLLTAWRPWFTPRAGTTRDWDPPTVGEQALLLSPGGDPAAGLILVGLYRDAHPAPSDDPGLCMREYPDGAVISYNHQTHHLQATLPGTAEIQAAGNIAALTNGNATIYADGDIAATSGARISAQADEAIELTSPQNTVNGPLHVTGEIACDADVIAQMVSLLQHVHGGVTPGGGDTGPPTS